jgi:hypothetical protein
MLGEQNCVEYSINIKNYIITLEIVVIPYNPSTQKAESG